MAILHSDPRRSLLNYTISVGGAVRACGIGRALAQSIRRPRGQRPAATGKRLRAISNGAHSRTGTVTVSYISSGLEIGPDIPDGTETIVECHKLARFLLWIMASIHVQVG